MSAAEPATPPTPPTLNAGGNAAVIPINARRTRRSAPATGGWNAVDRNPPSSSRPSQGDDRQAVEELAEHLEKAFNSVGRTLSDDETALIYGHTLGLVEHTLQGATASGIISEGQRNELAALISGMREAPQHV